MPPATEVFYCLEIYNVYPIKRSQNHKRYYSQKDNWNRIRQNIDYCLVLMKSDRVSLFGKISRLNKFSCLKESFYYIDHPLLPTN